MGDFELLHKNHFHEIYTQRLVLRPFTMGDAQAMFEYTSVPENFRYLKRNHHTDIKETETFLEKAVESYQKHKDFLWGITLKQTGQLIGTCRLFGLDFATKCGEVSYMVNPKFQGNGFISESIRALISYAFGELGLLRIQARCIAENIASERVMLASGMKFEKFICENNSFFHNTAFKLYAIVS